MLDIYVTAYIKAGKKSEAIKLVYEHQRCSLADAKYYVDRVEASIEARDLSTHDIPQHIKKLPPRQPGESTQVYLNRVVQSEMDIKTVVDIYKTIIKEEAWELYDNLKMLKELLSRKKILEVSVTTQELGRIVTDQERTVIPQRENETFQAYFARVISSATDLGSALELYKLIVKPSEWRDHENIRILKESLSRKGFVPEETGYQALLRLITPLFKI